MSYILIAIVLFVGFMVGAWWSSFVSARLRIDMELMRVEMRSKEEFYAKLLKEVRAEVEKLL